MSRLRAALLSWAIVLVAVGPAVAQTVTVPRVGGDVIRAYSTLIHRGLRVTIARPFTVRDDAVTRVTGVAPGVGHHLQAGAVVTLTVRCCRRLVHPPQLGPAPGTFVPAMRGSKMQDVRQWAAEAGRRYRARLAPLHAGAASTLLDNYIVSRQSLTPGQPLLGGQVLQLDARPGTPPPCTLPYYAYVLGRDTVAVMYTTGTGSPYATQDVACVLATGRRDELGRDDQAAGVYTYPLTLVGLRVAGVAATGPSKYDTPPELSSVVTWDLATGTRRTLYDAGTSFVPQVVLTGEGFTAWRLTAPPGSVPGCDSVSACPTAAILADDSSGLHTLDRVDPRSGEQLSALTLDGNVVSWAHDGADRSAALR